MGDSTLSVSKGVFVFNNRGISQYKRVKPKQQSNVSSNMFANKLWYQSYYKMWNTIIEKKLEALNNDMFASLLSSLVLSIKNSYNNSVTEIPTATLLTGINMPDHSVQFIALSREIKKAVSPHVAVLNAEDCQNLKHLVENTVNQFVNNTGTESDKEDTDEGSKSKIRKSQCTFALLQAWYEKLYGSRETRTFCPVKRKMRDGHKLLVIIIPDFESFNDKVIQDFILIISSYLNMLPFVMVFGVATSLSAVHKSLPYHVSSKISVQVFNSQQSTTYLNNVIEHVFFTNDCPFHLGGKVFNFFTDIFLFYDLSVKGFIKNFKFAMLEHFSYGNAMALCTNARNIKKVVEQLTHDDLENIRRLPSLMSLADKHSPKRKAKFANDDECFKEALSEHLQQFHMYLNSLHLFLKCLHILVDDLPKSPLGRQVRELYSIATSKNITKTPEYKECFQLLAFQSKDELLTKIVKICDIFKAEIANSKINKKLLEEYVEELENRLADIENATTTALVMEEDTDAKQVENLIAGKMNRLQLKEKLLELSKKSKPMNKYEQLRSELVKYLQNMFENYLQEPSSQPCYEIFFFSDMSVKRYILGSHRAAIHTALNDPEHYLQCNCCKLPNETAILPCMPDLSILYKLHLEYGKMINLYDWLQSFLSIVDPNEDDEGEEEEDKKTVVKPEVQARFTQAVADLEFLGFIKSSNRKADHVLRLTWGG